MSASMKLCSRFLRSVVFDDSAKSIIFSQTSTTRSRQDVSVLYITKFFQSPFFRSKIELDIETSRSSVSPAFSNEVFATTDNGNGMKYVGLIILASVGLFVAGIFLSYVADDLRLPAWNSYSVPAPARR